MNTHAARIGGLMRCCLETLGGHIGNDPPEPQPGDRLPCKHCSSVMVYSDGAWEWDGPLRRPSIKEDFDARR